MLRRSVNRRTFTTGTLASALTGVVLSRDVRAQVATPATPDASVVVLNPEEPVALGVMVEVAEDRAQLDKLAEQMGREPAIVMFHAHWGNSSGVFSLDLFEFLDQRGIVPLVTWEAWRPFYAGGVAVSDQAEFSLKNIVSGAHDDYIDSWIDGIVQFGKPVLLRFGHEMNGDWYPWGVGTNGNTAEDFLEAWRYLHDRFASGGATTVHWVWTPNATSVTPIGEVFPGDDYVDFVGTSGFNWGNTQQTWGTGTWQTFTEVFSPIYDALQTLSAKPVILAEVASAEEGGDKAAWITSAFGTELPTSFPNVRAIVWFNILKETDWRIDSSPEALRAFVAQANSPYLMGSLELTT